MTDPQRNLRSTPIFLAVLAHTGKPMGDDGKGPLLLGYRGFGFLDEDKSDPDPLVSLEEEGFETLPVYARGFIDDRITGGRYKNGIGGQPVVLLRKPAANALKVFRSIMIENGLDLIALDGYRPVEVQRMGFAYIVGELMATRYPGQSYAELTLQQQFEIGIGADDVFAYVNASSNTKFTSAVEAMILENRPMLERVAEAYGKSVSDIAEELVTYRANLRLIDVDLDADTPMAHRGGGALDLFPINLETGAPALLGVPFDYPCPAGVALTPSAMHYFEDEKNWVEYKELAERDPLLRNYLTLNGIDEVTDDVCRLIRDVRRVLFHAAYAAGWTHYINECFHFNAPNRGGNQAEILPNGGNTCQSLLVNARDTRDGEIKGNWSPATADMLAVPFGYTR